MINFKVINDNLEKYRLDYLTAKPIPHLAIKNFCDVKKIKEVVNAIGVEGNNSRDYVFAHNKFEKSNYGELHPNLKVLKEELMSEEFGKILKYITNRDVFVDPRNYGGGLHTGLGPARLDMHLDFNYHIDNPNCSVVSVSSFLMSSNIIKLQTVYQICLLMNNRIDKLLVLSAL